MLYHGINNVLNTQRGIQNEVERGMVNDPESLRTGDDNGLAQTSTNIFIVANNKAVGMIQSFNISESRTINKLQAVGAEGVVQAVPSNTNGGQISVTRIALYGERMFEALGLENTTGSIFKTLKEQRYPFEIRVLTRRTGDARSLKPFYIDTYVDCWLSSFQKSYTVQNITVSEQATIQYADVI